MARSTAGGLLPRASALLLAGLVLLSVWCWSGPRTPPLYDGLQLPPQPYRFLQPPRGIGRTRAPSSARVVTPITEKTSPLMVASTGERPPQAQLVVEDNAVFLTSGLKAVVLSIAPVATPSPGGQLDGNVYRFTATDNRGKPVRLRGGGLVSVALRDARLRGTPVMERYEGGRWVKLPTSRYVNSTLYYSNVDRLGLYALVFPSSGTGVLGALLPVIIIVVVALILCVVLLLLVRLARAPSAGEPAVDA